MFIFVVFKGSSQPVWLQGSQHFFLHKWPQGNIDTHISLHRARTGSVEQVNSTWCPHPGIIFVVGFLK
jgi:hypothetical protein